MTVNICFHGIGTPGRTLESGEEEYWITSDLYRAILESVADRDDVMLSFDDGNASDVDIALDGLRALGLRAAFFLLAGRLDRPGSVSSDGVRALRDAGMSIGTHGMDHRPWRGLATDEMHRELVEARAILGDVAGSEVDEAALPLGQYDRTVLRALRETGYRRVYTSDRRHAQPSSWVQPRYSVRRGDTIESVRSSILATPSPWASLRAEMVGAVKRIR